MKYILFQIGNYDFISKLDNIFKIASIKDVIFSENRIKYKDYQFIDLTEEIIKIIGVSYKGDYVILFSNEEKQGGMIVQRMDDVIEIDAKDLHPIPCDIFQENKAYFKQYYYDKETKKGALELDFTLI